MIAAVPERRVLFVDDDANVLRGVRRMMHSVREHVHVQCAEGGEQALDLMEKAPIDLIVADMQMPGMSGSELLATVMNRHPRTIRFALSGYTDREMVLKAAGLAHQFFAKPCQPRPLKYAMGRAFQYHELLVRSGSLQDLVSRTETLPVLPETYAKLTEVLSRGESGSLGDLADVVRSDMAAAAKIMHLSHWVFFGPSRRMRSLDRAVGFIGAELLRNLCFSTNLFREWPPSILERFHIRRLAQHSMACAALAERIARTLSPCEKFADDAAVAGLLHDIGKVVLASGVASEYEIVLEEQRETGQSVAVLERTMFGASHAEVGGALLTLWGIPNAIVQAVAYHHEPERASRASLVPVLALHAANGILHNLERHKGAGDSFLSAVYTERPEIMDLLPRWREMAKSELEEAHAGPD